MQKLYDEEQGEDLKKNGFKIDEEFDFSISVARLSVKNTAQAKKLGQEIGEYTIINSPLLNIFPARCQAYTQNLLDKTLKDFIPKKPTKTLVVGLGNEEITADAFGSFCINRLTLKKNVFAIKPNVYQNTNLMSFDIVNGVVKQLKPDMLILIDSLGTMNIKRLACSFQICNVGILPGGALHTLNKTLSKKTLGVPCVVIGVPLMIFAQGLNQNLDKFYNDLILTPKDIKDITKLCSKMVCKAIQSVY